MTQFHYADNSLTWVIGGAQGSGVDSAANIFSRACAQAGFHIFGKREYYSNIKGEHSYFTVRVSDEPIHSHVDLIDILVSFDAETVFVHAGEVKEGGAIIYDSDLAETTLREVPSIDEYAARRISSILESSGRAISVRGMLDLAQEKNIKLYGIPYFRLLKQFSEQMGDHTLSKLTRTVNVMALSASMAILNFDKHILSESIRYIFRTKPKIAENNVSAAGFVYDHVRLQFSSKDLTRELKYKRPLDNTILVQGNQSSALGKLVAGCRFQTYYPITPASDDSEFLESNQILEQNNGEEGSVLVVQTEDEIAAVTMAIGGALTGVRSATATSGPGFSLMVEALGWAGINEVPLVISLYQRAGPATGLPTRHEQGDLLFAVHAGHGEFPRIVFSSGDIEESFYDTIKVFNFAEKYQMPVIHLLDKAIANSVTTCRNFDQHRIKIDRGQIVDKVSMAGEKLDRKYLRFKLGKNPISPRAVLGTQNGIFWNTGDEHTEEGHITEDPYNRVNMMDKRMNKLDIALEEIPNEDKAIAFGNNEDQDVLSVLSWGSTKGSILDALNQLNREGEKMRFIQLRLLHPFPASLLETLIRGSKILVDIEMNYSAQLASMIEQRLKRKIDYTVVKYNGRPMSSSEIYNALKLIISGNAPRRQVLENGT
ncbi:MAG: 2-oxoacid:ferredoxin oxidoreductase subunit alpha [Nitrososphaeraceae archaeon]|jgi:2-oxoglutarate ferredoxin oxidoreductase subunit alpha